MKKNISPSMFELIFAAGITVILALPLLVNAQDHKEFKVTINNSDTIVNGKNIKDLSIADRKDALKKLSELNNRIHIINKTGDEEVVVLDDRGKKNIYIHSDSDKPVLADVYRLTIDSNKKRVVIARSADDANMSTRELHFGQGQDMKVMRDFRPMVWNSTRKNSQNFSYSNTDNDGISTHINYTVGDADAEKVKKLTGSDKTSLDVHDLALVPSFSTGKTTLSFSLDVPTTADVQFKDSEGSLLWQAKTNGTGFSKSFALPKNGIYYLQVKQGGKLALRRILKEE